MDLNDVRRRRYLLMVLAGKAAGRRRRHAPRWVVPTHEAGHAVLARAVGMYLGRVSAVPDAVSAGRTSVSFEPLKPPVTVEEPVTDRRAAIEVIHRWGGDWRWMRKAYRHFEAMAADYVDAHFDVIDAFAGVLFEQGVTATGETAAIIDRLEDDLNRGVLVALDNPREPGVLCNVLPQALARAYCVGRQLLRGPLTDEARALWTARIRAAERESLRRKLKPKGLRRLGRLQERAVARFAASLAPQFRQTVDIEHASAIETAAASIAA